MWNYIQTFLSIYQPLACDWNWAWTNWELVGRVMSLLGLVLSPDWFISVLFYHISHQVPRLTEIETLDPVKFLGCSLILIASFINRTMCPGALSVWRCCWSWYWTPIEVHAVPPHTSVAGWGIQYVSHVFLISGFSGSAHLSRIHFATLAWDTLYICDLGLVCLLLV
jgi:hypothetical protein